MNNIIEIFLSDGKTVIFSIVIIVIAFVLFNLLRTQKKKFEEMIEKYKKERNKNKGDAMSQSMTDGNDIGISEGSAPISMSFMEDYRSEFEEIQAWYNAASQLISVLPMLGILGTVLGLILQISSVGIDEITDSIGLALITTFWGLFSAIVLKVYDSFVGIKSENVQNNISKYENKLSNIISKRNMLTKGNGNE